MHRGPLRAAAADAAQVPQGAGPAPGPGPDTVALRQVFGQYPTGVAVVAVRDARGAPVAMTINSFTTVSLDPPLVAWSIGGRAADLPRFQDAPVFGISVLASHQEALARRFADPWHRRDPAGAAAFDSGGAALRVRHAVAWLQCTMHHSLVLGDHVLIVGRVEQFDAAPGAALAYHRSRYARIDGRAGPGPA